MPWIVLDHVSILPPPYRAAGRIRHSVPQAYRGHAPSVWLPTYAACPQEPSAQFHESGAPCRCPSCSCSPAFDCCRIIEGDLQRGQSRPPSRSGAAPYNWGVARAGKTEGWRGGCNKPGVTGGAYCQCSVATWPAAGHPRPAACSRLPAWRLPHVMACVIPPVSLLSCTLPLPAGAASSSWVAAMAG